MKTSERATNKMRVLGFAIAAAILTGVAPVHAQQRGSAPVSAAETLRGHKAVAVEIEGDLRHVSPSFMRTLLEEALKDGGIGLLPAGSFPVLRLALYNDIHLEYELRQGIHVSTVIYNLFTMRLDFVQLLPLSGGGSPQTARGVTWWRSKYGYGGVSAEQALTENTAQFAAEFIRDHRSVNGLQARQTTPADRPSADPVTGRTAAPTVAVEAEIRPFRVRVPMYSVRTADNPTWRAQITAIAESGQQTLQCTYGPLNPDGTGFSIYLFWYRTAPDGIREMVPDRLHPFSPTHPLEHFGFEGVSECPETVEAAYARILLVTRR